jgi:hypothetical protein
VNNTVFVNGSQPGFHGYIRVGLFTVFPLLLLTAWFVRDVTPRIPKLSTFMVRGVSMVRILKNSTFCPHSLFTCFVRLS